jgi:aryl-phospho-beta-D-glucosidase BglC (GH1 family)
MEARQQINVESMVGDRVVIQLHRQAYDALNLQGVESERFVTRVAGVDNLGVWIENPNYCTVPVYDDNGEYIAPENRKQICDRAVILIFWSNIQTIMQFPDRSTYQATEADTAEIGFRSRLRVTPEPLVPIGSPGMTADQNGAAAAQGNGKPAGGKKAKKERKRG